MNKFEKVVLITGCAGFIGAALSKRFLAANYKVIGIDNLNNYYDIKIKYDRLKVIENFIKDKKNLWEFFKVSIENIVDAVEENLKIGAFLRSDDIKKVINEIYDLFPIL